MYSGPRLSKPEMKKLVSGHALKRIHRCFGMLRADGENSRNKSSTDTKKPTHKTVGFFKMREIQKSLIITRPRIIEINTDT